MSDQSTESDSDAEWNWYLVGLSVPWIVRGVDSVQDAINIAVSEVGDRTSETSQAYIRHIDIGVQKIPCPNQCGTATQAVLLVADMAMIALRIEVRIRAKSGADPKDVARREIGKYLEDIPVKPVTVTKANADSDQR